MKCYSRVFQSAELVIVVEMILGSLTKPREGCVCGQHVFNTCHLQFPSYHEEAGPGRQLYPANFVFIIFMVLVLSIYGKRY